MEIYNIFLNLPLSPINNLPFSFPIHFFLLCYLLTSVKTLPLTYRGIIIAMAFFLPNGAKKALYNAISILLLYTALRYTFGFIYLI